MTVILSSLCRPGRRVPRRAGARVAARRWFLPLLALAVSAAARPVPEQLEVPPPKPVPTAAIAQQGPVSVSLERAKEMASSRYGGRVARAQTTTRGGRRVHEITILGDDQRVRIVRIDAETGQFL